MSKRTDRVSMQVSRVVSNVLLRGLRDKKVKPVGILRLLALQIFHLASLLFLWEDRKSQGRFSKD